MKQGKLFYDKGKGRYNFLYGENGRTIDYGGLHCRERMEVRLNDVWVPTRIEMNDDWYLVGLPGVKGACLEGLEIRMGERS